MHCIKETQILLALNKYDDFFIASIFPSATAVRPFNDLSKTERVKSFTEPIITWFHSLKPEKIKMKSKPNCQCFPWLSYQTSSRVTSTIYNITRFSWVKLFGNCRASQNFCRICILLNKRSGYDMFTLVCADSSETPPSWFHGSAFYQRWWYIFWWKSHSL